ncbi:hypothetical protein [Roseovarius sp. M141]|uniref:DUF7878 domain-containing protein n=1 Tax=Roseovarius sp. M141 TaxID=2583806 RepID=UPI0020CDBC95|nr:hypothetical protein [Roseovarius sp. M141]MCQ0093534.1 hypothetical protein [Roseovarius sp. M141]
MIHISFNVSSLLVGTERYRLITDTEGELTIFSSGKLVFSHDGILLVEFARCLSAWVAAERQRSGQEFFYSSMDFEEEPVLAFKHGEAGGLIIVSALVEVPRDITLMSSDLIRASKNFLHELYDYLSSAGINPDNYDTFARY